MLNIGTRVRRDVRFALRLLARDRAFVATAILLLGLGIGVNNMMFTVIYGHTLRKLPMADPDRVLFISTFDERVPDQPLSYPDVADLRGAAAFSGLVAYGDASVTLSEETQVPERAQATYLTSNAFDVIGRSPVRGRMFTEAEDTPGSAPVALLGRSLREARYENDEEVLGRVILVNGAPATIIGIVPDRSGFPSVAQVWMPLAHMPGLSRDQREITNLRAFGRLRQGVSKADAIAEVESIIGRSAQNAVPAPPRRARVVPISERFLGRASDPAWVAFMAVGFIVLFLSCANVANLLLARSLGRTREIAVRLSLGATRGAILRQLLIESSVLAALGGVAGLVVSLAAIRLFQSAIPAGILPYWLNYAMDMRVLAALVAVTFATVVFAGGIPAFTASRTDVNQTLKDTGQTRGSTGRWSTAFLVAQFAFTVLLLSHAVANQRRQIPRVLSDETVTTEELLTASITLPAARYRTADERARFFSLFEERLRQLPEVAAASLASTAPFRGTAAASLERAGVPAPPNERLPGVRLVTITPGYFAALGVPLVRGHDLPAYRAGEPPSAIVSERFVETFYKDDDVLGKLIRLTGSPNTSRESPWITITGIAADIRYRALPEPEPVVYLPFDAGTPTATLVVRSRADHAATASALRTTAAALDPGLPVDRLRTMTDVRHEAEWNGRLSLAALTTLTLLGVCLVTAGLYASTAHGVVQRRRELAVRMALGAQQTHVARIVLQRATWHVTLGLLAGVICTIIWDSVLFSGRPNLRSAAPDIVLPVAAILTVVMLIACLVPAQRAARVNPASVLKGE